MYPERGDHLVPGTVCPLSRHHPAGTWKGAGSLSNMEGASSNSVATISVGTPKPDREFQASSPRVNSRCQCWSLEPWDEGWALHVSLAGTIGVLWLQ